ncbi:uncharacterized protein LOC128238202 isoform X2 [Mya arenaria]|uniref:uncharacterized protein LOC128238202 isoform X2 n=1 Tax=Mya arenaria TaxID=6604 RepID=UPI0022E081AC|nr:uncharacterized protein LOC128238202 isoform X2 [Mya arenaria]
METVKDVIHIKRESLKALVCNSYLASALKPMLETHIHELHNACIELIRELGMLPWDLCAICKSGKMCWRQEFVKGKITYEILLNMREWFCPNLLYIPVLEKLQVHHRKLKPVEVPDRYMPMKRQTETSLDFFLMVKEKRNTDEINEHRRLEFRVTSEKSKGLENWFSNSIAIFKCFLPENCKDVRSMNDIQPCGLLSGILNCDLLDEDFSFSLYENKNLLSEVHRFAKKALLLSDKPRGYYNKWERNAVPLFLTLLQDPKCLNKNVNAQEVVLKILKVIYDQVTDAEFGTVLGTSSITDSDGNDFPHHLKWGKYGDCSLIKLDKPWSQMIQNEQLYVSLINTIVTEDVCLYCKADNVYLFLENSVQLKAAIDMSFLQLFSTEVVLEKDIDFVLFGGACKTYSVKCPHTEPFFEYLENILIKPSTKFTMIFDDNQQRKRSYTADQRKPTYVVELKNSEIKCKCMIPRKKIKYAEVEEYLPSEQITIKIVPGSESPDLQRQVDASTEEVERSIHMQATEEMHVRNDLATSGSSYRRGPQIGSTADQTLPSPFLSSLVSQDNRPSLNRSFDQAMQYRGSESDRSINRYSQPSRAVGIQESHHYNIQRNDIAEHDDRTSSNHRHLTRNEDNTLQNIHTVKKEPIVVKKQPKYPAYVDENERFRSFSRWSHMIPSPTMLCKAGFFFTNTADLVRCYQCGIGLKDFSSTDDPLKEHVKHSSQCEHLLLYFETESALENYKKSMRDLEPGAIRQRQLAEFRERSLQGIDDHVRCFACDGGLRHWDPEDDPWIEHCRWFPACPFAREQKGDEFIALVQASADQNIDELGATGGNSTNDMAGRVNNLHITDPDIKRLIEEQRKICTVDMGFSNEMFSSAVNELRQQGTLKPSVEDIVIAIEVINDRNQHSTEIRSNGNKDTSAEELLEENKRLKHMLTCFICQNNPVNALFLPCTHHRLCIDCSYDLKECPVCLRPIKEKIKTFMG